MGCHDGSVGVQKCSVHKTRLTPFCTRSGLVCDGGDRTTGLAHKLSATDPTLGVQGSAAAPIIAAHAVGLVGRSHCTCILWLADFSSIV